MFNFDTEYRHDTDPLMDRLSRWLKTMADNNKNKTELKVGDLVVAIKPCGMNRHIPMGTKGKIVNIENRSGYAHNIISTDFYKESGITATGIFSGMVSDPFVELYDLKHHIKEAIRNKEIGDIQTK